MRSASPLTASIALTLGFASPAAPAPELTTTMTELRAGTLSITVPSAKNLGNAVRGGTTSAHLGTVTVTDERQGRTDWITTVSATNFITTGGSITKGQMSYWSGPVTAQTGQGTRIPGQPTAANATPLSAAVTAFTLHGVVPGNNITSWNPTLVLSVPAIAVVGNYTGTITHSVA
jgi:hypothetical protein